MTLDEAIIYVEETADNLEREAECIRSWGRENDTKRGAINCEKCAEEHRQLAEWLKDYKRLLEQEPILDKIRAEIEQITDTMGVSYNQYVSKIDVLRILDKYLAEYKVESEDKE